MLITGLPYSAFADITCRVSARTYDGNIVIADWSECSATRFHASIRAASSRGKGARRAASGRRIASACWHAHRDILIELFRLYPAARVRSRRLFPADYRGVESFRELFPDTGQADIGWKFLPVRITELCECSGNVPRTAAETRVLYEDAFALWQLERLAELMATRTCFNNEPEPEPERPYVSTEPITHATVPPAPVTDDSGCWVNTISPA